MLAQSIVVLGKTEEWFWTTELRIVWNLLEEAKKINKVEQKNLAIYTALAMWGKLPDEENENGIENKVPGRDVPLDPSMLRRFI